MCFKFSLNPLKFSLTREIDTKIKLDIDNLKCGFGIGRKQKYSRQFESWFWYLAYNKIVVTCFGRTLHGVRENLRELRENLKNKIRFLVDDLEDYLSCDASNISDMIGFKMFSFRELVLEYGPDHMSTVKVLWNASQQKFNLIFGGKLFFIFISKNIVD